MRGQCNTSIWLLINSLGWGIAWVFRWQAFQLMLTAPCQDARMIPRHSCWQLCSQHTVQKTIWCQIIMLLLESHKKYTAILTQSFCTTLLLFLASAFLFNIFLTLLPRVLPEEQKLRIHVCTVFRSNQRPQKTLVKGITCNLSVKTRKQDITIKKTVLLL